MEEAAAAAAGQPSNYVTLLHLRERWLKENERIQKEKEEQEQLEQQQKEKNDRKPVIQKPRILSNYPSRNGSGKFPVYYRAVPVSNPRDVKETCKKTEDKGELPLAVSRIEKDEKETFERIEDDEGKPPMAVPRYYRAVPASNPRNVKEACKKTEDEGQPPLAVPRIEKDEKKKNSPRKGRGKKPKSQKEEMDRTPRTPEENLKEEMREPECEVGAQNGKKSIRARRIHEKNGNLKENPRAQNEEIQTPEENLKKEMQETEREVRVQNGKKNVRARRIDEKKGILKENPGAQNEEVDRTSRTPEENLKEEMQESECEIRVGKKNVRARRIDEKKEILKENPRAQNEEIDRESRTPEENSKKEMRETECNVWVGKKNVRARRFHEKKGILKENPRAQNEEMDRESKIPEKNLKEEMRESECEIQVGKKNVRARRIHEKKGILKESPRAQNEEMDRESRTPEENLEREMRGMECEVGVQNGKNNVWARKIDEKKRMESQCGPETGYTPEMKEMENKLGRISVSFKGRRERNNGVYRGSSRSNRNLHCFAPHRQKDVEMIWVRKDEISKGA